MDPMEQQDLNPHLTAAETALARLDAEHPATRDAAVEATLALTHAVLHVGKVLERINHAVRTRK